MKDNKELKRSYNPETTSFLCGECNLQVPVIRSKNIRQPVPDEFNFKCLDHCLDYNCDDDNTTLTYQQVLPRIAELNVPYNPDKLHICNQHTGCTKRCHFTTFPNLDLIQDLGDFVTKYFIPKYFREDKVTDILKQTSYFTDIDSLDEKRPMGTYGEFIKKYPPGKRRPLIRQWERFKHRQTPYVEKDQDFDVKMKSELLGWDDSTVNPKGGKNVRWIAAARDGGKVSLVPFYDMVSKVFEKTHTGFAKNQNYHVLGSRFNYRYRRILDKGKLKSLCWDIEAQDSNQRAELREAVDVAVQTHMLDIIYETYYMRLGISLDKEEVLKALKQLVYNMNAYLDDKSGGKLTKKTTHSFMYYGVPSGKGDTALGNSMRTAAISEWIMYKKDPFLQDSDFTTWMEQDTRSYCPIGVTSQLAFPMFLGDDMNFMVPEEDADEQARLFKEFVFCEDGQVHGLGQLVKGLMETSTLEEGIPFLSGYFAPITPKVFGDAADEDLGSIPATVPLLYTIQEDLDAVNKQYVKSRGHMMYAIFLRNPFKALVSDCWTKSWQKVKPARIASAITLSMRGWAPYCPIMWAYHLLCEEASNGVEPYIDLDMQYKIKDRVSLSENMLGKVGHGNECDLTLRIWIETRWKITVQEQIRMEEQLMLVAGREPNLGAVISDQMWENFPERPGRQRDKHYTLANLMDKMETPTFALGLKEDVRPMCVYINSMAHAQTGKVYGIPQIPVPVFTTDCVNAQVTKEWHDTWEKKIDKIRRDLTDHIARNPSSQVFVYANARNKQKSRDFSFAQLFYYDLIAPLITPSAYDYAIQRILGWQEFV